MENDNNKPQKQVNNYLKYSGIGFQIAGTAVAGFFLGHFIDGKMQNSKPYFTAALSVLFLAVGMYVTFKDLLKKP